MTELEQRITTIEYRLNNEFLNKINFFDLFHFIEMNGYKCVPTNEYNEMKETIERLKFKIFPEDYL